MSRGGRPSRLTAWVTRHLQVLFYTLGQLTRSPLATLMTAAVIGIALALPAGLYQLLDNISEIGREWQGSAQFSLYLKESVTDEQAAELAKRLGAQAGVDKIKLITRSDALAEYQALSGFADALSALEHNPLPAVILVQPGERWAGPKTSQQLVDRLSALSEVEVAQFDMQWTKRLYAIMAVVQRGVIVLGGLFALAVLLVIGNTIRLSIQNRRTEIEISKLVGATNAFIRRPFLYTGVWLGLLGGLIGWLLVDMSLWILDNPVRDLAGLYQADFSLATLSMTSVAVLLASGSVLGWLGSRLAVGRHLKEIEPR